MNNPFKNPASAALELQISFLTRFAQLGLRSDYGKQCFRSAMGGRYNGLRIDKERVDLFLGMFASLIEHDRNISNIKSDHPFILAHRTALTPELFAQVVMRTLIELPGTQFYFAQDACIKCIHELFAGETVRWNREFLEAFFRQAFDEAAKGADDRENPFPYFLRSFSDKLLKTDAKFKAAYCKGARNLYIGKPQTEDYIRSGRYFNSIALLMQLTVFDPNDTEAIENFFENGWGAHVVETEVFFDTDKKVFTEEFKAFMSRCNNSPKTAEYLRKKINAWAELEQITEEERTKTLALLRKTAGAN